MCIALSRCVVPLKAVPTALSESAVKRLSTRSTLGLVVAIALAAGRPTSVSAQQTPADRSPAATQASQPAAAPSASAEPVAPLTIEELLAPLDIVRPTLPPEVAAQVAAMEARIAELEQIGLTAETREAQDSALDEAIALAEQLLVIREQHQGEQASVGAAWASAASPLHDDPHRKRGLWWEVLDARTTLAYLEWLGSADPTARAGVLRIQQLQAEADALYQVRDFVAAERAGRESILIAEQVLPQDQRFWTSLVHNHASMLVELDPGRATPLLERARQLDTRLIGCDHPETVALLNLTAGFHRRERRDLLAMITYADAIRMHRWVDPGESILLAALLANLGTQAQQLAHFEYAEAFNSAAVEMMTRLLPPDHPYHVILTSNLARLYEERGRLAESIALYERVLGRAEATMQDGSGLAQILGNFGKSLRRIGRFAEAEEAHRRALALRVAYFQSDHDHVVESLINLSVTLQERGRMVEAESALRAALAMLARLGRAETEAGAAALDNLGVVMLTTGQPNRAEPYFRRALSIRRVVLSPRDPFVALSTHNLSLALLELGRFDEAADLALEATTILRELRPFDDPEVAASISALANCLTHAGRPDEAGPLYEEALAIVSRLELDSQVLRATAINNLATHLDAIGQDERASDLYAQAVTILRSEPLDQRTMDHLAATLAAWASVLFAQGDLAGSRSCLAEASELTDLVRTNVLGGLEERASLARRLNLPARATQHARVLVALEDPVGALGALERGRGRAVLDSLLHAASSRLASDARSPELTSPSIEAASRAERAAEEATRDAETKFAARARERQVISLAPPESLLGASRELLLQACDRDLRELRSDLDRCRGELLSARAGTTAALRETIPAANPLTADQILAALAPGEALLTYAFTEDGAFALVARDGNVTAATLASTKEDTDRILTTLPDILRRELSLPTDSPDRPTPAQFHDARAQLAHHLLPEHIRESLRGTSRLVVIPDGPLQAIPMEVLLAEDPDLSSCAVAYAPSATIYIDRVRADRAARASAPAANSTVPPASISESHAIILGDPSYGPATADTSIITADAQAPDAPASGALLAVVPEDSPAHTAGLRRGDILLTYDQSPLDTFESLRPVRAAVEAAVADGSRPADQPVSLTYWRDGQVHEASAPPGPLGVTLAQAPAADALRSMRTLDQLTSPEGIDQFAARASMLDQVRLYGAALSPLPGTRHEAGAIASLLPGATVLLADQATAPNLRAAVSARAPRYLHLATHGLMGNADRPQDASLALTRPGTPTHDDTGFLTLEELLADWGGDLRGTDLVVLSACDTGLGVQRGDTVLSLPLGFFHAGAPTVIASLWKVDDQATALLMARLYENLLGRFESPRSIHGRSYEPGSPMTALDALDESKVWLRSLTSQERDALLTLDEAEGAAEERGVGPASSGTADAAPAPPMVSDPNRPYSHPRYWAAFTLIGSPE